MFGLCAPHTRQVWAVPLAGTMQTECCLPLCLLCTALAARLGEGNAHVWPLCASHQASVGCSPCRYQADRVLPPTAAAIQGADASISHLGIKAMILARTPVMEMAMKIQPSINTAAMAVL